MPPLKRWIRVALDIPIAEAFDYEAPPGVASAAPGVDNGDEPALVPGDWVLVPWGNGRRVGLVLELDVEPAVAVEKIRPILGRLPDAPAADPAWLALGDFASRYYHRPIGEVLLSAVPKLLRTPPAAKARGSVFGRARQRFLALSADPLAGMGLIGANEDEADRGKGSGNEPEPTSIDLPPAVTLTPSQQQVLTALAEGDGFQVHLLHGITGSGKTEVYLQWIASRLAADPASQLLMMIPEIGLSFTLSP